MSTDAAALPIRGGDTAILFVGIVRLNVIDEDIVFLRGLARFFLLCLIDGNEREITGRRYGEPLQWLC